MLKLIMKVSRLSVLAIVAIALLTVVPFSVSAATDQREVEDAKVILNGSSLKLESPLHMVNGRMYLPVGLVAKSLSASVSWDSKTQEATIITKSNDEVVFGNDVPTVYFNDQRYTLEAVPYLYDSRLYVPVRYVAEVTHATAAWDIDKKTLTLTSVPLEVVSDENSLAKISADHNLTQAEVVKRNKFSSKDQVKNGMKLAVILPSILDKKAKPFTNEEYQLLAKIVQVESGYESYEGQLAVANVILNRVANSKFPDSIKEVIYSGSQFPPAHNGLLAKADPNASVLQATKDALNGKNNVEGAVYFFNPKYSNDSYWSSLTVVATIGNHRFAK
ncbi:cell wall hydrolase [Paenibacillus endoradicis]|uniref:cell wall hydrolase n=1 Tax=Paenibacillus endoradicis TaxID=2972487 RepID=UPI0021593C30|nr:cell wall hydrolase [Paenibacillus endoradicis]MCR8657090.1 stalk domain-containing protein [Paenibacillus endoradicis]